MRRPDKEAELQEELQFHLEEEAGERQARSARRRSAARGPPGIGKRRSGAGGHARHVDLDIRGTTRAGHPLRPAHDAANKTFSAMAILSLALGIGANTAIFSFMDSILLRSLPVPDPQSLVMLSWHTPRREMHGSNRHDE